MFFADSHRAYFAELERFFARGETVFLGNPHWTEAQRREAFAAEERFRARSRARERGRIFIASGGSGGKIRFVAHTSETLEASARGLVAALGLPTGTPLNCFACLPPWHVGGLMPFVRARVSGGRLFVSENGSFREGGSGGAEAFPEFRAGTGEFWMNSLVPTQLLRISASPRGAEWARGFDFILLGGAAVPADLIADALARGLKFGIGYGMTETASLVALWRSESGLPVAGTPLPHARISVSPADSRIEISADSLGETLADDGSLIPNAGGSFLTNDEGRIDEDGRLRVLGRADRHINSGGEKVDPAIVESALLDAGASAALVVGEPDAEWGERVVALAVSPRLGENELAEKIAPALAPWMRPKRIVCVPELPFDEKGKIRRAELEALLRGNA